MADVHNKETRSYNMSQIRAKDTKPEILVRKFLFSKGFRFRIHDKKLPGKPDIVLRKYQTVIFIHGCFWHGHDECSYYVVPKSNTDFWVQKIKGNKEKDIKNLAKLIGTGWRVITIFECQLKPQTKLKTLNELLSQLH
ncbi:MAG: very short patch repair endonuclease [Bacteroidota bacterium]